MVKHTPECDAAAERWAKLSYVYHQGWPDSCQACYGSGVFCD